ncbi:S9 family peptidase [Tateyamaria pelophila]|uniref:S9 family peptidase n=1 Tax=Tateyamaria pelophila TaxID=328415 RepID=UPI001CBC6D43|nr:S9 family peptidase [Tateyamaria pelophila]
MSNFPALPDAPVAEKRPTQQTVHGVVLNDDYHWLRAENWQEAMRDPAKLPSDIAAYLNAENDYYEAAMADTIALQKELVAEMRGRIKEDDASVARKNGPYLYGRRFRAGDEHPVFERTPCAGGPAEISLDVQVEATAYDYFNLGAFAVSPDHQLLAWSADTSGAEFYTLRIRDLKTGKDTGDVLEDIGSIAWADPKTLFYVRVDANHRPNKVFRHTLGSDPAEDVLVFEEKDPRYHTGVGRMRSGAFISIQTGMNDENETMIISTSAPETPPQIIAPRRTGIEYTAHHQGDHFVILTNESAVDFKVVLTPVDAPGAENWVDFIAHEPGRMIIDLACYRDWTIWLERSNALPHVRFVKTGQNPQHAQTITFEEEAYSLGFDPSPEYDTDDFRFVYSSPTTPLQTYSYPLSTGKQVLLKEAEIPSGHDPAQYITRRITAQSHDGAGVPVTILHHKDTVLDGSAPCLLYGYGSYGMSMPASFSTNRLSLVDRGFVYAIAHVRGGEEKGRNWYEAAKFDRKVNSFYDMIAAGQTLAAEGYTSQGQIVIQGGSAGGLLVGAVVNMAPDLLAGVIADVPFVDVLNTILDDTLPLTPGEWSQWGNPIENEDAFADIRSYSPYDNVVPQAYPAMLVTAGVSDPRVTYWEPAKWVAKLRATKTDGNALLLRTNMTSGHFGKSGRFAALEDAARSFAFALKAVGKV